MLLLDSYCLFSSSLLSLMQQVASPTPLMTDPLKAKLFLLLQLCSCFLPEGHISTDWKLGLYERKLFPIWMPIALYQNQSLENPITQTNFLSFMEKNDYLRTATD